MKIGQQPAFPVNPYPELSSDVKDEFGAFGGFNPTGLTKREYFAAMAMQGLAMNRTLIYDYIGDDTKVQFSEIISKEAVRIADELLKQLNP